MGLATTQSLPPQPAPLAGVTCRARTPDARKQRWRSPATCPPSSACLLREGEFAFIAAEAKMVTDEERVGAISALAVASRRQAAKKKLVQVEVRTQGVRFESSRCRQTCRLQRRRGQRRENLHSQFLAARRCLQAQTHLPRSTRLASHIRAHVSAGACSGGREQAAGESPLTCNARRALASPLSRLASPQDGSAASAPLPSWRSLYAAMEFVQRFA